MRRLIGSTFEQLEPRLALEIDDAVALGAAHQFIRILARRPLDQQALDRADT